MRHKIKAKFKNERFKYVRDTKQQYIISNYGRLFSVKKNKIKELKKRLNNSGYHSNILSINGKQKSYLVHRMVAFCFIENKKLLPQINHKNGIKTDNYYKNLQWCNASGNVRHSFKNKLQIPMYGEDSHFSKLKTKDVLKIKNLIQKNISIKKISKKFNVSYTAIWLIKKGKTWTNLI